MEEMRWLNKYLSSERSVPLDWDCYCGKLLRYHLPGKERCGRGRCLRGLWAVEGSRAALYMKGSEGSLS